MSRNDGLKHSVCVVITRFHLIWAMKMLPCGGSYHALLSFVIVLITASTGSALHFPLSLHNRDTQQLDFWRLHRASRTASTSKQQQQHHDATKG